MKVCLALIVGALGAFQIASSPVPTDCCTFGDVSRSLCSQTQPPFPLCPATRVIDLFIQQMFIDMISHRRQWEGDRQVIWVPGQDPGASTCGGCSQTT